MICVRGACRRVWGGQRRHNQRGLRATPTPSHLTHLTHARAELLGTLSTGVAVALAAGAALQVLRYASGTMPEREVARYARFFALQPQDLVDGKRYYTEELRRVPRWEDGGGLGGWAR